MNNLNCKVSIKYNDLFVSSRFYDLLSDEFLLY